MSSHRSPLILTTEAQEDYAAILAYTRREWGDAQRDRYDAAIVAALTLLTEHPQAGRTRDDLYPGCRAYAVDRHIIYYGLSDTTVIILRILHGRADARRAIADQ